MKVIPPIIKFYDNQGGKKDVEAVDALIWVFSVNGEPHRCPPFLPVIFNEQIN